MSNKPTAEQLRRAEAADRNKVISSTRKLFTESVQYSRDAFTPQDKLDLLICAAGCALLLEQYGAEIPYYKTPELEDIARLARLKKSTNKDAA